MKNTIISIVVVGVAAIVIGLAIFFLFQNPSPEENGTDKTRRLTYPTADTVQNQNDVKNELPAAEENKEESVLGKSVENRDIVAYHYGDGDTEILFIGGIHGGYSWNTALVAYETMDYLKANLDAIPANIKVTVIPVLNPDGLAKVAGTAGRFTAEDVSSSQTVQTSGRFNANGVDLNRNFDCDWQSKGTWQKTSVSGGDGVFSEPESVAIKNYIEAQRPKAVVVWYSAAGGVFASSCHEGVLPETDTITNTYAKASGYPAYNNFDFYQITGDMVNWLAKEKIPAISVLLSNHKDTEWAKNKAGIEALLNYYAE